MRKKKNALGYTYLAPALISILLVTCLPIIYTVILSFTNYNMYHLNDYSYVGWEITGQSFLEVSRVCSSRFLAGRCASQCSARQGHMLWDWYLPFY